MSNQAKANKRAKRLAKAKNMRKNNGVGRTAAHQAIHDAQEAQKVGVGSRIANGLRGLMGK